MVIKLLSGTESFKSLGTPQAVLDTVPDTLPAKALLPTLAPTLSYTCKQITFFIEPSWLLFCSIP